MRVAIRSMSHKRHTLKRQHPERRAHMNKDQVKGVTEKVKGKVNQAVGNVTNDPAQQAKGDLQEAAGEVRKGYGDAKEDLKDELNRDRDVKKHH